MATPKKVDSGLNMEWGIGAPEPGLKIERIRTLIRDPKTMAFSEVGSPDGYVHNYAAVVQIEVTGEYKDDDPGRPKDVFGEAIVLANEQIHAKGADDFNGITVGEFALADEAEHESDRAGWRTFTATYIGWPDVTYVTPP